MRPANQPSTNETPSKPAQAADSERERAYLLLEDLLNEPIEFTLSDFAELPALPVH
jgi:hypothetical protein